MATSLSSLVDNLSKIKNKDCKKCIERNKIKSECKFIFFFLSMLIFLYMKENLC